MILSDRCERVVCYPYKGIATHRLKTTALIGSVCVWGVGGVLEKEKEAMLNFLVPIMVKESINSAFQTFCMLC